MADMITGRNAVLEALKSDREIEKLIVAKGAEGSIRKITGMAKDKKIPVQYREKAALDRIVGRNSHQGVIAQVSEYTYCALDDILRRAEERGEDPFIMILDGLEDPHNLGAVMRTAECCGAHGIVIPKRHSAGITETVAKASAGAVEYMLCARVSNIGQAIDQLKERGMWVAACDMGGKAYTEQDLTGSLAVVIGSEGTGISRLVREKCDFVVSIPMKGKITSLNASNAAAILMYEVVRQRERQAL
ncbi:23S rRNA (guanosine(2251)-2'-O)-methyltransferase RlmB [Zhenpiania hominis]|uniref:23S rRNA (guanosine(2251)-2'-O)-methyltransferase RlmB n=1 Tax=Zhenpiania hominis TaxID=2763644 RepID=UPI0039F5335C